jgi:PAS domain S-box-containing protein
MDDESVAQIKALKGQLTRYGLLSEAVLLIAESADLHRMLSGAINKLKWVLDFDRCTLALVKDDSESYELRSLLETRRDSDPVHEEHIPLTQGIPGEVIQTKRMRLVKDHAAEQDDLPKPVDPMMEGDETATILSIPLKAYGQIFGSVTFGTGKIDAFDREDIKIAVSFATHLALGIDRWKQTEDLKEANESLQQEIDERQRAQEALRESEERYALAMQGANDGLWDWDVGTGEIHVSPGLKTLIGLNGDGVTITPELWQSRIETDDLGPVLDALRAHLRGETEFFSEEFRTRGENGEHRWLLQRGLALRDDDGQAYRMAGSLGDISDRKQAEIELTEAKEQAEKALGDLKEAQANLVHAEKMASLGQMTAGIAHEIKNPLNFVNNFSQTSIELLDDLREVIEPSLGTLDKDSRDDAEDLMETLKSDLDTIANHGRRADGIVKNMLLHSRGTANDHEPTDVNALVEESLNLAYHGERARDSEFNVSIEHDFDPEVGAVDLLPQEISRVLVNLFGNGFYATRKRKETKEADYEPTIKVATRNLDEGIEIRVRDNGTGMPAEVREKLFTPFFTTKPTGEGTGLGLSLSYDIITQQHKGSIDADSKEGSFTEFTIRLPRKFGDAAPQDK